MTTGLYPQSLIISFPQSIEVKGIKITGSGSNAKYQSIKLLSSFVITIKFFSVKHVIVEKCSKSNPTEFEMVSEKSKTNLEVFEKKNNCKIYYLYNLAIKIEDDRMQSADMKISHSIDAKHIKFIVNEGYSSFIAIQHIKIDTGKGSRSER